MHLEPVFNLLYHTIDVYQPWYIASRWLL